VHEAILYKKEAENKTKCRLCRHTCLIKPGERGICGVRENRDGVLYSLVYDKVAATGIDPIEKKPFFHFHPGTLAYSMATMGCNFSCAHCQNCHLSRSPADRGEISGKAIAPRQIVATARGHGCLSLSYTYSEPTVFAELVLDTSRIAKEEGLYNTWVTNGYASPELIEQLAGLIDAANIDLKAWSKDFYKTVCQSKLDGVLDTIKRMHRMGVWIEITTLLIPELNDDPGEIERLAGFIAEVDVNIPWHISRYHPAYRMQTKPITPIEALAAARETGRKAGLKYVYAGNVPGNEGENTDCPQCGKLLIHRYGFSIRSLHLEGDQCPDCGEKVAGRFQ
jgi:pyruvate formate lyase activating enzyme